MKFTPFYFSPLNTLQGFVLVNILSLIFGSLATLYLISSAVYYGPETYFTKVVRDRPKELDAHGTHKFINLPKASIKLHYVSKGNDKNQLMIFLHGFPQCWYTWKYQLKEFSKKYHAVAVDMRGYGESEKPKEVFDYTSKIVSLDIIEMIEILVSKRQNKKVILVGHDWGGVIAWGVANDRPDLIDKLIFINAPHPHAFAKALSTSWEQFFRSSYMFFFNVPYISEAIIEGNDYQLIDKSLKKYSKVPDETDVYKYYLSLPNGLTGPLNYYRASLREVGQSEIVTFPKVIQPKALIIWGKDDVALSFKLAGESAKHCAHVTVEIIEKCSHFAQIEKPNRVNRLIKRFLSK